MPVWKCCCRCPRLSGLETAGARGRGVLRCTCGSSRCGSWVFSCIQFSGGALEQCLYWRGKAEARRGGEVIPEPVGLGHGVGRGLDPDQPRSEERRVGKEWVSTFRSCWSPYH